MNFLLNAESHNFSFLERPHAGGSCLSSLGAVWMKSKGVCHSCCFLFYKCTIFPTESCSWPLFHRKTYARSETQKIR